MTGCKPIDITALTKVSSVQCSHRFDAFVLVRLGEMAEEQGVSRSKIINAVLALGLAEFDRASSEEVA